MAEGNQLFQVAAFIQCAIAEKSELGERRIRDLPSKVRRAESRAGVVGWEIMIIFIDHA